MKLKRFKDKKRKIVYKKEKKSNFLFLIIQLSLLWMIITFVKK